jgi:hypothetical protein
VLPDNRVIAGQRFHLEPLRELIQGAAFLRGIVSGLDREGVAIIRKIAGCAELQQLQLIIAVYGGSRTWDDILFDLLGLQDATPGRIAFRVLARRIGPDRPANLLWVQPSDGSHGHLVISNVANLLVSNCWDPTDAVLSLPVEPGVADALRKWFDNLHAHSRPLTVETAGAPRLRLPEGDLEGNRLWRQYLELLDGSDTEKRQEVVVDPKTGEIESAAEPTPSAANTFPRVDPVLLAVQTVLAKGSVVALDKFSRAPPLDAPLKPEHFGHRAETRSGAARHQQRFSVSLFDADTARRLEARKAALAARLASCSLMLRDGVRWVPDSAGELLNAEFAAVEREAAEVLTEATGGKSAEEFVGACLDKIVKDCADLSARIAPGHQPPTDLAELVKAELTERLRKNLEQGMVPGVSRSRYQLSSAQSDRESPWDQVQTFLASAARLPREVFADARRMFGLLTKPDVLVAAFNVFHDHLVARCLEGWRVEEQARREVELIKVIQEHDSAIPKQRAHALYRLIEGNRHEEVTAALTDESIAK